MEDFVRCESKYLLTELKYQELIVKLKEYIEVDVYDRSHIMSIYYDTDDDRLLTRSIEKPIFKEKLRIRSYDPPLNNDDVYIELKKKLDGVVYKSRTRVKYLDVLNDLMCSNYEDERIGIEIKNLYQRYVGLYPKIFVSCDRKYFVGKEDHSLRITFDSNIKYRTKNLTLSDSNEDRKLDEVIVMEIKGSNAMPLWLVKELDELNIYKSGFSKVGTAFLKEIERNKYGVI